MKVTLELLVISTLMFVLLCCAKHIEPLTSSPPEKVVAKNYTLGEQKTVFVGQPIISVKEYQRIQEPFVKANNDFLIDGSSMRINGKAGTMYPIRGRINHKSNSYLVVDISSESYTSFAPEQITGILVSVDGKPTNYFFTKGILSWSINNVKIVPDSLRFDNVYHEKFVTGQLNFELLYGGTDGKSFSATYREYTPDDIARPAFAQSLNYENKSDNIRFRDILIRIHEITSEKIVYTVVDDGL